jgi:hypothetical protein
MESGQILQNRFEDNINNMKIDSERKHNLKHSTKIQNFIFSKRNINSSFFNKNINNIENDINEYSFNSDLINNNISQVIYLFEKIHQDNSISLTKNQINEIKKVLLDYLTKIRKELSKDNISIIQAKNIFNTDKTKIFCELLINPMNDTYDPFIYLESIWIINNLMFLVAKFKELILFDITDITKYLIQFLINIYKNQKDDGVKYTLEEKVLRIFGNLLYINNNILNLFIDYSIIPFIIESLNSPIPSFRISCLWIINKMLLTIKKNGNNEIISLFTTKTALSNYKFILSRIKNQNSIDEISELFWIFNELVKYDSSIIISIFFYDINKKQNNNLSNLNEEYIINTFQFIVDNCFINKILQPSFRLISNLLIICYKDIKNEYLLSKLVQILFEKQTFFRYINELIYSQKNTFDISFTIDILLLIFNLVSFSPINSRAYFKNGIINLINNKEYLNNQDIQQMLLFIYYKMMKNNSFYFESNDEIVIKSCLNLIQIFKDNNNILYILIDLFYFYLKASNINIGENIENELNILINTKENNHNNNLIFILMELSNLIKMKFNSI